MLMTIKTMARRNYSQIHIIIKGAPYKELLVWREGHYLPSRENLGGRPKCKGW